MADPGDRTQTRGMSPPSRALTTFSGPPRQTALWLWLCASAGVHVALFLIAFGLRGAGLFSGGGVPDGDGFGGTAVEIEITGSDDGPMRGSMSAGGQPAITPAQEQHPEEAGEQDDESAPALTGELDVHVAPAERAHRRGRDRESASGQEQQAVDALPARALAARGDPSAAARSAPGAAETPSGTGADDSSAGAPAGNARDLILGSAGALGSSISAQRALLPNGGACSDPIAGTWRTQKYRATDHTWVRFVLQIRNEGGALAGTITSRIWTGMPSDPTPSCTAFGFDNTWRMEARGHLDGTSVRFASYSARLVRQDCPNSEARYAPDNFTGTVDPMREVFASVNNDGAFDIDEPYTFRRVSCE